ncbi:MAG TPA: P-loop NTPase, partial [Ornithinimicrobium sp.]|nr:P-loop NTPase [Ornithinimicrobium sp.]
DDPSVATGWGGPGQEAGEVVVVWGPVGSTGRSTVAANLAAELADPLSPVVLVDADTYGASQAQLLAVLDEVPGVAAAARAADQGALDRDVLARLAPEVRPGLRLLTGLPRADRWPELRDVALADVLEQCRGLARWTVVDVAAPLEQDEELSFDTLAPRRNGAALTALAAADRVVVVGTGDPVGLQRLVRALDQLGTHSMAPRSVVVTRVRPGPVGPDPGRRIQETLARFAGTGPVHLVPEDQDGLDAALLHGRVLAEVRPRSAARTALVELADTVAGREPTSRRERAAGRARGRLLRRPAPV